MAIAKNLGIWMDHQDAHLIEIGNPTVEMETVKSAFTHQVKEESIIKSESLMHNKEQHQESEYYHKLADIIKNYESALLFGPTHAKDELYNILKKDHHFSKIKIYTRHADKLTKNQQHAFVKDFFANMPITTENNIF